MESVRWKAAVCLANLRLFVPKLKLILVLIKIAGELIISVALLLNVTKQIFSDGYFLVLDGFGLNFLLNRVWSSMVPKMTCQSWYFALKKLAICFKELLFNNACYFVILFVNC